MPSAEDVRPEKWSDITVLFDDGDYSVISGMYQQRDPHLGERWNGQEGELGFPNVSGHAVWHIVPEFLEIPVLHGMLDELASDPDSQPAERSAAILRELSVRLQRRGRAGA